MKYMLGLMVMLPMMAAGQLYDDFTDGDLHADPTWQGDTHLFEVNPAAELWLNAPPTSGNAYLSVPSTAVDTAMWSINVRMTFNPSSSNYTDIVLMSDSASLSDAFHGYFVRLGGTSDEVSLWRKDGTGEVELIDGMDDFLDENQVEVQVLVERSNAGNWQLWSDTGSTSNLVLQGSIIDETYTSSAYFGIKAVYTSTRSDRFFYDDIHVSGSAYPDTLSPQLNALTVLGSDSLRLTFNEAIAPSSTLCDSCFQLSRKRIPAASVRFTDASRTAVVVGFGSTFRPGRQQVLWVNGLYDDAGNMASMQTGFTYYPLSSPQLGDVIIHEFMADPEPPVGLTNAEYIELFNRSERYIALDGLTLADANTAGSYEGTEVLEPKGYVLLCSAEDSAELAGFGKVCVIQGMPTLNNGSDALAIRLGNVLLDSLNYDRSWYQSDEKNNGGYSLERINPAHPCSGPSNWLASAASSGGTPGRQNSVFDDSPDRSGPRIRSVSVVDQRSVALSTNEALLENNLSAGMFTFDVGPSIDQVMYTPGGISCTLSLDEPLQKGLPYFLAVEGLQDCFQNESDTTLRIAIGVAAQPFDLVFSELRPAPDEGALPNVEYVELFNRSERVLSTHGLRLSDATSGSDLPEALIWPGAYVVLVDDGDADDFNQETRLPMGSMPSLNNNADALFLQRYDTLIDVMAYTTNIFHPNRPADEGWSLERRSMDDLCGTNGNWTSSAAVQKGTPGKPNSVSDGTASPPAHRSFFLSPTEVEVELGQRLDTTSGVLGLVNGGLAGVHFDGRSDRVRLVLADSLTLGEVHEVSLTAMRCDRQLVEEKSKPYLPKQYDVVINEVLFNPRGSGSDYVELYNRCVHPIDLRAWSLPAMKGDTVERSFILSDTHLILPPSSFLAFTEDEAQLLMDYPYSPPERIHEINLPSYPNDEGIVALHSPWNTPYDQLNYNESLHFELLTDPDGIALERINPDLPSDDPNNWTSASSADNHGTPGYKNSQYTSMGEPSSGVSLSQLNLSPDGDGYEDIMIIHYDLPFNAGQLSASVYTDQGVLVHQLASNRLVGNSGALTWDGSSDQGIHPASGIYIILVEAFHTEKGSFRYKLPFTVQYTY
jgi:hypothetical protein